MSDEILQKGQASMLLEGQKIFVKIISKCLLCAPLVAGQVETVSGDDEIQQNWRFYKSQKIIFQIRTRQQ